MARSYKLGDFGSGGGGGSIYRPGQDLESRFRDMMSGPRGNDIVDFQQFDPPDDRYIPGYSKVEADGDVTVVGPRLKDLNIPFSLYGLPIPITFGVRRLYGNLIWTVPLRENVKKKKKGGKGGAKKKTVNYEYYATFAVGFGYPGIQDTGARDILRMWADGSLIYDRRSSGQTKIAGLSFVFYPGDETHEPDPTIEEYEGDGLVPAYRGLMYAVIKDLPVGPYGDRVPSISIEVGDVTAPVTSITNIYPDAVGGLRDQYDILPDWSRLQAYTLYANSSYDTLRTYDLVNNSVVGYSEINPAPGVGWSVNDTSVEAGDLANLSGFNNTVCTPGYIPWLGKIIGTPSASGAVPIFLADAHSGVVTHWIGCKVTTTAPAFPANEVAITDTYPFFKGNITSPSYFTPQLVYGTYGADTYIFCQSNTYDDLIVLHLRSRDDLFDMLTYEEGVTYQEIVQGTQGIGYSDVYLVGGSTIYRVRLDAGAKRQRLGSEDVVTGYTKTTWKSMGSGIRSVFYYKPEDSLIVFLDSGGVYKYDCSDGTEIYNTTVSGTLMDAHSPNKYLSDFSNGSIAWDDGAGTIREFDIAFGTVTAHTDQYDGYFATEVHYDSVSKSFIGIGTSGTGANGTDQTQSKADAVTRLYFDRLGDERIPLSDFLEGVSVFAGYDPSEIYVDPGITDEIDGALITNITTFRNIMSPVTTLYRIDMVESDGKIKFLRKALGYSSTDFTISDGETLLPSEDPEAVTVTVRREEEVVVPERVNVRYLDKSLGYQWSMQFSTRSRAIETNQSNTQITYEVPIIMSASEAKTLSYRSLWTAWNSRVSYSFRVNQKFMKVEPGDVGTLAVDGIQYTVKAMEVTYHNDHSLSIKASNFSSDENLTILADAGSGYPQTIPYGLGASAYVLDIPLLKSIHDINYANQFPVYVRVGPNIATSAWTGGSMFASYDSLNYIEEVSNTFDGFVGIVITVPTVPDSILQIDNDNDIVVYLKEGDSTILTSATESELLNGANTAAYGRNGRWEVIQFRDVTDNGDGTYTLSGIMRGRRGTDYAVDNHKSGDLLILLDDDLIDIMSFSTSEYASTFRYKPVAFDADIAKVVPEMVTLNGYGMLPWVPTNLRITRDLSALTGDITISWNRRSRTFGEILDGGENAPLDATELDSYLVSIKRWPYYDDWQFIAGTWTPGSTVTDTVVTYVQTSGSITLTATTLIRDLLYGMNVPDNLSDVNSTFSDVDGGYISANTTINQQIYDLGYPDFTAFKYLDIMIQQKTNLTTSSGYGPGRWMRVYVDDL